MIQSKVKHGWYLRDIPEFFEKYEVFPGTLNCPSGEVWSKEHFTSVSRKDGAQYVLHFARNQLVPSIDFDGYIRIKITIGNQSKYMALHRIIAEIYCPNDDFDIYSEVNHLNGDKQDNRPENLEWCTSKRNRDHAIQNRLTKRSAYPVIDLDSYKIYTSTYDVDREFNKCLEYTRQRLQQGKQVEGRNLRLLIDRNTFDAYTSRFAKYQVVVVEESDGSLSTVNLIGN